MGTCVGRVWGDPTFLTWFSKRWDSAPSRVFLFLTSRIMGIFRGREKLAAESAKIVSEAPLPLRRGIRFLANKSSSQNYVPYVCYTSKPREANLVLEEENFFWFWCGLPPSNPPVNHLPHCLYSVQVHVPTYVRIMQQLLGDFPLSKIAKRTVRERVMLKSASPQLFLGRYAVGSAAVVVHGNGGMMLVGGMESRKCIFMPPRQRGGGGRQSHFVTVG